MSEINTHKKVTVVDGWNDILASCRKGDHPMGRALHFVIDDQCSKNMPAWACDFFTGSCYVCALNSFSGERFTGLEPILDREFGTRGQKDLKYCSSVQDGDLKFSLACRYHGIFFLTGTIYF